MTDIYYEILQQRNKTLEERNEILLNAINEIRWLSNDHEESREIAKKAYETLYPRMSAIIESGEQETTGTETKEVTAA